MSRLLDAEEVVMHPFVLGEITLGSIRNRSKRLAELRDLTTLAPASDAEVVAMIEWRELWGTGLACVDAHLLAAVQAAEPELELSLWTRDKRLRGEAERLGIAYAP